MPDEELNILEVKDFNVVKQFSLDQKDFTSKLNELRKAQIDRFTLGTLIDIANNFTESKLFIMEDSFRNGFAARLSLTAEHENIAKKYHNLAPFNRLKNHSDMEFAYFTQGYQNALQGLVYSSEYAKKVTQRLSELMGGGDALSAEAKTELVALAKELGKIADKLQGYVKPFEK